MSSDYGRREPLERRRRRDATTDADMAELARHYQFVPATAPAPPSGDGRATATWQERMVQHYHQHLYKEYVLADLRYASEGKLGLRWRIETEVAQGKGSRTCGNKHCPSYTRPHDKGLHPAIEANKPSSEKERAERQRLLQLSYGDDQAEFEVPFSYHEHGLDKTELVKLRLCAKCAPLLFISKSKRDPCLMARGIASDEKIHKKCKAHKSTDSEASSATDDGEKGTQRKRKTRIADTSSTSSDERSRKRRAHKRKKSRKHRS